MRYSIKPVSNEKFQIIDNETGLPYGQPYPSLNEASCAKNVAEGIAMQDRIAVCQRGQCGI